MIELETSRSTAVLPSRVDHEYEQSEARHLVKVADSFDAFRRVWKLPKPPTR